MSAREHLEWAASLGLLIPAAVVIEILRTEGEPDIVSTVQAARLLGYSPKWWRVRCARGLIDGAYLDGERWRLPITAGRAYILKRRGHKDKAKVLRGPNRKAQTAQAGNARRASGEAGPLVHGGPTPIRRVTLHVDP
jgi:hypothetical protein